MLEHTALRDCIAFYFLSVHVTLADKLCREWVDNDEADGHGDVEGNEEQSIPDPSIIIITYL